MKIKVKRVQQQPTRTNLPKPPVGMIWTLSGTAVAVPEVW